MVIVGRDGFERGLCLRQQAAQHADDGAPFVVQRLPEIHARQIAAQALAAIAAEVQPRGVRAPDLLLQSMPRAAQTISDGGLVVSRSGNWPSSSISAGSRLRACAGRRAFELRRRQHIGDVARQHVARGIAARARFRFVDGADIAWRLAAGEAAGRWRGVFDTIEVHFLAERCGSRVSRRSLAARCTGDQRRRRNSRQRHLAAQG